MRYRNLFLFLIFFSLANFSFSQKAKSKLQFDVLDENRNFFKDLKNPDIQIAGFKDFSLDLMTDKSLEIVIMVDASASQERTLPFEKKAAQTFISDFLKPEKDKVAVVSFKGEAKLAQDFTNDFNKAKAQIEKIKIIPPNGYIGDFPNLSTSIWDSLKQVLENLSKNQNNGSQRAVILISDGVNNRGETKIKEITEFSVKSKIPIYAIGIGGGFYPDQDIDKRNLKKITEDTGGISIVPKKRLEDLSALLKIFEQSLRSTYEITFTQSNSDLKNIMREIEIKIINPELRKRKLQIIQPKFLVN